MTDPIPVYLASASPRRSELLQQIGVRFSVFSVDVDETPLNAESPRDYVERLARLKAETAWQQLANQSSVLCIGADTTVTVDGMILGKPENREHALDMLRCLSGKTHQVMTGVAIAGSGSTESCVNVSDVTFRELSETEMVAYWNSGECVDKAGAYAIQGLAALFISHLQGSYSSVMGLPVYETGLLLKNAGVDLLEQAAVDGNLLES